MFNRWGIMEENLVSTSGKRIKKAEVLRVEVIDDTIDCALEQALVPTHLGSAVAQEATDRAQ